MGITANSGPFVGYGITQTSSGAVTEYNEERGPSLFDLGFGTLDPRSYFNYGPGNPVGTKLYGFFGGRATVNYVPTTLGTSNISPTATTAPTAGTALTLSPSSSLGALTTTIIAPALGTAVSVIAIDSTASYLAYGTGGTIAAWNPAAGAGRCIVLTPSGNSSLDGGSWTIAGRDVYGIKVSETLAVSSQAMTTLKSYKYISSIIAATTIGSTGIGVGFNDTYGLPLVAPYSGLETSIRVIATSSLVGQNSSGPITIGASATATSTTGDVRGTYASSTASNGTVRLQISQNITANMVYGVTATDTSAMFGVTQYSSV